MPKKSSAPKAIKAKTPTVHRPAQIKPSAKSETYSDFEPVSYQSKETNLSDQKRYVNIREELTSDQARKKTLALIFIIILSSIIIIFWLLTLRQSLNHLQAESKNQELTQQFNQALAEITNAVATVKSKLNASSTASSTLSQTDLQKIKTDVLTQIKNNLDATSWPQHISEAIGLSLQYPTGWQKKELKNELIFNDTATGTTATLDIKKFANDKGVALADWLAGKTDTAKYAGYLLTTSSSSTLDKVTYLEYASTTTGTTTNEKINSLIIMAKDKSVYEINLMAKSGYVLYDSIFNKIIGTIKFLNLK